jgi:hypothetical protein
MRNLTNKSSSQYSKEFKPLDHRLKLLRQKYPDSVLLSVAAIAVLVGFILVIVFVVDFTGTKGSGTVIGTLPDDEFIPAGIADGDLQQQSFVQKSENDEHEGDLRSGNSKVDKLLLEIQRLRAENIDLKRQLGKEVVVATEPPKKHSELSAQDEERRRIVVEEFKHAWKAYKECAWGTDDLHPIRKSGTNGYYMAMTMIDALDTMYIMGLKDEFQECKNWMASNWDVTKNYNSVGVNNFEVSIRVVGGLLSAFYLSKDDFFLEKAADVADVLMPAFNSASGIPFSTVQLDSRSASNPDGASSVSEAGTIQLEWQTLTRATGKAVYSEKIDRVNEALERVHRRNGLFSRLISPDSGQLSDWTVTLGARVDSIYEYFLKEYIMSPKKNPKALEWYLDSMKEIKNQLYVKDDHSGLMYIQELINGNPSAKMDHLVCFLPGLLALGTRYVPKDLVEDHMEMARQLTETCYRMYKLEPTGLAPEIVRFENGIHVDPGARHNLLRPETLESLHIMHEITGDTKYKEWGWEIFEAFRKYTRVPHGGYSAINNVGDSSTANGNLNSGNWRDHMESFFLAETLKYSYLLFSGDLLPLDKWVFNTEAHPLPIWPS